MPYIEKRIDTGKTVFVKRYFASRYGTKGQIFRSSSVNTTCESQERVNDKLKIERFSILVNANFGDGDYFNTFTYRKENRPADLDEAREQWNSFLRRLRYFYKKNGQELKYAWCCEYKGKAFHFHLICNNPDINSKHFSKLWKYGTVHVKNLDDRAFHSVGEYMMKEQYIKEEKTKTRRCYGSSKNLYRPEADITILDNAEWEETPQTEQGYELDVESLENGETFLEGVDIGFRYQSYRLLKTKLKE